MKACILIIEDERELAELVRMYLEQDGVEAIIAPTAERGLEYLADREIDLIVLDINLPGMDGFEFLQKLRLHNRTPVVVVSAREADEDIVLALGIGADEFVTKPFAPRVLVARVRALLRRAREGSRSVVRFGPYTLDPTGYTLTRDENRVVISTREFEVLRHLATNPGVAMSSDRIYSEVWQNEYGDTTAVAVYVRRIRQKIEEDIQHPRYIQTIHGSGYRFNPDTVKIGPAS
jgi:two-component system response regulator RegX3